MSLKRQIKTQLIIFIVFLFAYVTTFLYLFQKNYQQFNTEIYKKSQSNLEVVDTLTKVETNLYIHKKALFRLLNTQNQKWAAYMKESEEGVLDQFKTLEGYNQSEFGLWVTINDFFISNAGDELEKLLSEMQKGRTGDEQFQRLFYLVRFNIQQYFEGAQKLVGQNSGNGQSQTVIAIDVQENQVKLIYTGINQLMSAYNNLFWNYAQSQNSRYNRNTNYYYRMLMISSIVMLLFGIFTMGRIMRYFNAQQMRDERLAVLGAKDLVTGLFNKQSFEIFGSQELERAKRRGYHLSLLVVVIDPYEQILADFGQMAIDRLFSQIADTLRHCFRAYDGIYKYDHKTFSVLLSETDFKTINSVVERFKKKLFKFAFLVKSDQTKLIAQVRVGFAVYPTDGENITQMMRFALGNASANFDAYVAHQVSEAVFNEEPIVKITPEKPDAAPEAIAVTAAEVPVSENVMATPEVKPDEPLQAEQVEPVTESAPINTNPEVEIENVAATQAVIENAALAAQSSLANPVAQNDDTNNEVPPDEPPNGGKPKEVLTTTPETPAQSAEPTQTQNIPESATAELENFDHDEDTEKARLSAIQPLSDDTKNGDASDWMDDAEPIAVDSFQEEEILPDVVMALHQNTREEGTGTDGLTVSDQRPEIQISQQGMPVAVGQSIAANQVPSIESHFKELSSYASVTTSDPRITTGDFQVRTEENEDVILVDFDREKNDLAQRFRKKLKEQRKSKV